MIATIVEVVLQKSASHSSLNKIIPIPDRAEPRFDLSRYLPAPGLTPFIENHWIFHQDVCGQPPYVLSLK